MMPEPLFPRGGPEKWREEVRKRVEAEKMRVRLDPYRPVEKGQVGTVPIMLWPEWLVRYKREVVEVRWEEGRGVVVVVRERMKAEG